MSSANIGHKHVLVSHTVLEDRSSTVAIFLGPNKSPDMYHLAKPEAAYCTLLNETMPIPQTFMTGAL
jgi:hypothetical protein